MTGFVIFYLSMNAMGLTDLGTKSSLTLNFPMIQLNCKSDDLISTVIICLSLWIKGLQSSTFEPIKQFVWFSLVKITSKTRGLYNCLKISLPYSLVLYYRCSFFNSYMKVESKCMFSLKGSFLVTYLFLSYVIATKMNYDNLSTFWLVYEMYSKSKSSAY